MVYTLILRYVGDRDRAEDLAQEVFVRAWTTLPRFRGASSLSTWLYRIARNVAEILEMPIGTVKTTLHRAKLVAARELEARLRRSVIEAPRPGFPGRVLRAVEEQERERLRARVGIVARDRRRLVSTRDLLPAGLLMTAVVAVGLILGPEAPALERLFSAKMIPALGRFLPTVILPAPSAEWAWRAMFLLGARGRAVNPTFLYPVLVLSSVGFGLARALRFDDVRRSFANGFR